MNEQIRSFVSSSDVESVLDVGGDMRKIQHCFAQLKRFASTNHTSPSNHHPDGSHDNEPNEVGNKLSLDDAQVERLREILEQRDNEIGEKFVTFSIRYRI